MRPGFIKVSAAVVNVPLLAGVNVPLDGSWITGPGEVEV